MSADAPPGAVIARLDALALNAPIAVDVRDGDRLWSYLVVRLESGVRAFENLCPHARFPLERVNGSVIAQRDGARVVIVCAAHGASFDAQSGACVGGQAMGRRLRAVAVTVEDGIVRMSKGQELP